ncbi:MAG: ABC transporter transmembrane domain-containing protein [Parahaliea sp.]
MKQISTEQRAFIASADKRRPLLALLRFLRPYRLRVFIAGFALVFTSAATLGLGRGIQVLIDSGFSSGSDTNLSTAIIFFLSIAAAMTMGACLRFYLVSWLGERVSADLRQAVFNNLITLHPGYFESHRSGEIMSRLTTDTTLLQSIIGSSFSMALRSTLTLIGALVMMFITNFKLSLIIVVSVPVILMPMLIFGRRVRALSSKSQDSIASVGSYAGEIIQNIKIVQSYTQEIFETRAFAREVTRAFDIARHRAGQRTLLSFAAMALMFIGLGAMLWTGGQDVLSGRMSPGELGAFIFYAVMVGMGFATIAEVWGELQRAAGATDRLLELLHERSAISENKHTDNRNRLHRNRQIRHASMTLNQVCFAYPTRPEKPALKNFNLDIPAGKSLALVGPSGAGKSTTFELLQRFYDPQSGSITLDGIDIREFSLYQLRSHIALVPQQPVLFSGDVRYNIAYGREDASMATIINAASAAHAHNFIQELPEGYASHLGEQGVRLSGGQRQRIAIARAILNDPDILLLDEATSALDTESEFQVQQALQELMKGRTTVIIAHRLSTILHANQIAVIDNGSVVATGTHQSLLQNSPLYARLASLQFRQDYHSHAIPENTDHPHNPML